MFGNEKRRKIYTRSASLFSRSGTSDLHACIFDAPIHVPRHVDVSRARQGGGNSLRSLIFTWVSLALNVIRMPLYTPAGVFFVVYTDRTPLRCAPLPPRNCSPQHGHGGRVLKVHVFEILHYLNVWHRATPRRCRACRVRAAAPSSVATATCPIQLV
jgi:hypothetical protein